MGLLKILKQKQHWYWGNFDIFEYYDGINYLLLVWCYISINNYFFFLLIPNHYQYYIKKNCILILFGQKLLLNPLNDPHWTSSLHHNNPIKTLICHCKCYNVMQCAMWISRFNIYLWNKVVLFCFVTLRSPKPQHFMSCSWYLWNISMNMGALTWF